MYETAKRLELVEVEVYGCFILFSYTLLRKTLILCNWRWEIPRGEAPVFSPPLYFLMKKIFQFRFSSIAFYCL